MESSEPGQTPAMGGDAKTIQQDTTLITLGLKQVMRLGLESIFAKRQLLDSI
jgi:hypothetical protein